MDFDESTTLVAVLRQVPDPRKRRGQRFAWSLLWTIIGAALLSAQRTPHAIAHWAHLHADELLAQLQPPRPQIPSEATIRRALRQVDRAALEQQLTKFSQAAAAEVAPAPDAPPLAPPAAAGPALPAAGAAAPGLQGYAVDGKAIRGAGMHGPRPHLVSLVRHADARVLAQRAVAAKRHESSAVRPLLEGRDLRGCVLTMDAGLTQRALAAHIVAQHGAYLMVVKRNQRQLYEDLALFFHTPPLPCDEPWREVETVTKGHGRLETRQLSCTADLEDYLTWPGVQQVLRRTCERIVLQTGVVTRAVTYGLTSLPPRAASAAQLEALWRGHWRIENQVHYVRDVTFGEDQGQAAVGSTPQALAALRNALLVLLRRAGWTNIADALRVYSASVRAALQLLGVLPARL
jgi:predicted transposase YbfD/YdcC